MPVARVLFQAERVRFLRAERHTPLPGGPGIDPLDITVGVPGAWLRRGRWLGNAHPLIRATRGLDRIACSLKPREESRGGAPRGEHARSALRRQRRKSVARAAPGACAGGNAYACGAVVMRMRLSALRFPHLICPGGDVSCRAVPKTRMPPHRENDVACSSAPARSAGEGDHLAKRDGGGEPALTLSLRVKEFRHDQKHRFIFIDNISSSARTPTTIFARSARSMVPSPRETRGGEDEERPT